MLLEVFFTSPKVVGIVEGEEHPAEQKLSTCSSIVLVLNSNMIY